MTRASKRPRLSINHINGLATQHVAFTNWAKDQGVEVINVSPQVLPGRGLGLIVTKPIKEGARILFVPESTIFKPNFPYLRQNKLESASSQARLVISALAHFAPDSSDGRVWRDTWPTTEDFHQCMPLYWDELMRDAPRSTQAPYETQKIDYKRDWLTCSHAVSKLGHSEELFKYYWLIVNSRSFHWAPPRGGSGFMVMCPFIDYMNHGPTGSGVSVMQRSDGYEVIAQRAYKPGEEILASYGAHTNDKLLVHYGFLIGYDASQPASISVDDGIRIDKQVQSLLDDRTKEVLQYSGYLGPFALVPRRVDGGQATRFELCFKTQVAVRATFLTTNEWEFFAENGEDLGDDVSRGVIERLVPPLQKLLENAHAKLVDRKSSSEPAESEQMKSMINTRWRQIASVVRSFCQDSFH